MFIILTFALIPFTILIQVIILFLLLVLDQYVIGFSTKLVIITNFWLYDSIDKDEFRDLLTFRSQSIGFLIDVSMPVSSSCGTGSSKNEPPDLPTTHSQQQRYSE